MPNRQKRMIKAEDLYQFQGISGLRGSPDGRHAVYVLQRVDRKTEKKYTNLWVVNIDNGEARPFTYGDQNDSQPVWSPDGTQIAFLSNRGDKEKQAQLYLLPFFGGEARPLGHIDGEISNLGWSPDGKRLVCTVRKLDPETLERQKDEQKKKLGVVARHYDRVFYKLDGYGYLPHERLHIWTVDVRSGKARQLTDHAVYDEQQPAWSPDGKWIAFVSNRSPKPDFAPDSIDLYVMPAQGGEFRRIPLPIGEKIQPAWSPDGKWIAYYGAEGEGLWYKNLGLWVAPSDGSGKPRNLTEKYDLHAAAGVITDRSNAEQLPPLWSNAGQRLYFPVMTQGTSPLMSIGLDGEDLQTVIGGEGATGSPTYHLEQKRLVYFYGKMDDPGQVYVKEMDSGEARQLTRHNRELLEGIDLGQIETVWIKGPAGNDLQGWILKPPGFNPKKKYPSILEIHGGPLTQYGFFMMHEFYFLAAQGYVVHFCNPRGGRGYGEAHAGAIWGAWGGVDYEDVMAWTDHVAKLPYIDAKRMGVTGGSYGGYMTLWIVGHTQRFKAAVTQRCVSNLVSMWGSSDFNWTFQLEAEAGAPFEDLQKHWDMSPMKYIGNARTPTLVIHNEGDLRCPIEQGEQAFVALKRIGVDTEMVRFPDEFHGLSRTGRTDRRIARINHIKRWFERYL